VSRYQKGKTNLDFTEARGSKWQWHQLGHKHVCTSLQTDNHASTSPLSFYTGRMPFLPPSQQRQSTEGSATRHKIGHFGDVLPNQSLDSVLKKTKPNQNQPGQHKTNIVMLKQLTVKHSSPM